MLICRELLKTIPNLYLKYDMLLLFPIGDLADSNASLPIYDTISLGLSNVEYKNLSIRLCNVSFIEV